MATIDATPTRMLRGKPVTFRRVLGWLQVVLTLAIVVFWFFELRPISLGGNASYAIISGKSMEPVYHTGDVVIVHKHSTYKVHDIVAYKVPKGNPEQGLEVIHRLKAGNGKTGWIVQGDNRTAPDIWHPKNSDIVGSAWLHVPSAGSAVNLVHSPIAIAALAALIAIGVVLKKAPSGKKDEESDTPDAAATPPDAPVPAAPAVPSATGVVPALPPAPPDWPAAAPEPVAVVAAPPEPVPAPAASPEPAATPAAAVAEERAHGSFGLRRSRGPGRRATDLQSANADQAAAAAAASVEQLARQVAALEAERAQLRAQLDALQRGRDAGGAIAGTPAAARDDLRQRELEAALTNAFLSAERAGAELRIQAHQEAERILADAHRRADAITGSLSNERDRAVSDLRAMRHALEAALSTLEQTGPGPGGETSGSPRIDDLFGVERLRTWEED
jgi:signal peptidase I